MAMSTRKKTSVTGGRKGLIAVEWVMLGYTLFTLLLMLLMWTRLHNPYSMLWFRFQAVMMLLALWGIYRMLPCRLTMLLRVLGQIVLLGSWYPDIFEFSRTLPSLDHVFAAAEQSLFGCQPALLFSAMWPQPVVSELMKLGYSSYYFVMVIVPLFYFCFRKELFLRASFVMLASFFLFYVIFLFLPVAGPQYYYLAAGTGEIAQGHFPDVGYYFETHQEPLPIPGWTGGLFHQIVVLFHNAGERPVAAFPSSHVGIMTVLLWLAWQARNRWLFWGLVPLGVLMFFGTFYIQAHYAIDAIAGLFFGTLFYFVLRLFHQRFCPNA